MSKADEMFEELNYRKIVRYTGESYVNDETETHIYFKNIGVLDIYTLHEGEYSFSELTLPELNAIMLKIKELKKEGLFG